MMYQFFPFLVAASFQTGFGDLPVEIAAIIFRYLDGPSLLNAVRTSRKWASICRSDPVLRKRVREQLVKEIEYKRQLLMDPRLSMIVSRQGPPKLFNSNVKKEVSRQQQPYPTFEYQEPASYVKPLSFKVGSEGVKKVKKMRKVRPAPYRMRA